MALKGEIEEGIKALDFPHTVIIRPGWIVGGVREKSRPVEAIIRGVADVLSWVGLRDAWSQDVDVIARATLAAGLQTLKEGDKGKKVWVVDQPEILKLGREG